MSVDKDEAELTAVIGISGKIGSGKDYLATHLETALAAQGFTLEYNMFAKYLKQQANTIIDLIRAAPDSAVNLISERMGITPAQANHFVLLLKDDVLADRTVTSYTRAPSIRATLQYLGTDVRRAQNQNYWTNLYEEDVAKASTNFMFATDCRFPNEADTANRHGITIRLEVPEDILAERRLKRDGFLPHESVTTHHSETALDDYEHFTIVLGATYDTEEVVQQVLAFFKE